MAASSTTATRRQAWARATAALAALIALLGAGTRLVLADEAGPRASAERSAGAARAQARDRRPTPVPPLQGLDLHRARVSADQHVVDLPGDRTAYLSVVPSLERHIAAMFETYEVPEAAVVAIEPQTGRILALVSRGTPPAGERDVATSAGPPAASVFKVVTAAALIDAGVPVDRPTCYHGGSSRLLARHLADDPQLDRACATMGEAMGHSINPVFAKLASRHLERATLERYASAFGFGESLPFDISVDPSRAEIPDHEADGLEFARTAAGFWHTHMSPLHGALIAATLANDGAMPKPSIVDRVENEAGAILHRHEPRRHRAVLSRATARAVGQLMTRTVTHGTSRSAFHDPAGRPFLPGIEVAGKTGSLSEERPYRGYTWWVGYAPLDNPTIAVAALIVKTPLWRIKASYAARETLRHYLVEIPARARASQQPASP